MPNASFVAQITPTTYGVFALLAVVLTALIRAWPAIRAKVNEARRDQDAATDHLLDRYEKRLAALEESEARCRKELAETERRVAELEGFMMGQGKARQDAANIVAVERLTDARARDEEKKGKP